jgi:rod shape-determining protein MreC
VARSRRSRRTLTVVVLVVVSLSLVSLDLNGRTHSVTSGIKSAANQVYAPLRQGVMDIISPIGNFFAGAFNYGSVEAQNAQLRRTVGQLRLNAAARGFQAAQLRQLTALQHVPFLDSLTTVTAQTIDEDSSNFTATITLDKGRDEGVDVGFPVVGAGGLVGQVVQSFHHTSVVRLVTDGQSKVGVAFGPQNRYSGIVDGQGPSSSMTADLVAPGTPVRRGQVLSTSGLDAAAFPSGIPVARVRSFHTAAGASQESITVDPAADLDQLTYVDVVQWTPPAVPPST